MDNCVYVVGREYKPAWKRREEVNHALPAVLTVLKAAIFLHRRRTARLFPLECAWGARQVCVRNERQGKRTRCSLRDTYRFWKVSILFLKNIERYKDGTEECGDRKHRGTLVLSYLIFNNFIFNIFIFNIYNWHHHILLFYFDIFNIFIFNIYNWHYRILLLYFDIFNIFIFNIYNWHYQEDKTCCQIY